VAIGNRADAGSLAEDALTTLGAHLAEISRGLFYGYEQGIQCWDYGPVNVRTYPMYSQSAGHYQNAVCILDGATVFLHGCLGHLVTGDWNNGPAADPFIYLQKTVFHLKDLVYTTGFGHGGAGATTDDKHVVKIGQLLCYFLQRFLSGY
jgi:hypothetical protein